MTTLDTNPHFSPEAQETFTKGSRVYLIARTINLGEGAEGTYLGKLGAEAIVDWDTPGGEPRAFVSGAPFDCVRNLHR